MSRLRRTAALLAAVALPVLSGCNESTSPDEHENEIASIELTVVQGNASNTFTFTQGATTQPTLRLPVGTSTVTAEFLDFSGQPVDLDPDGEHELEFEEINPSSALDFDRTSHFGGTITAPAARTATVTVCLTHGEHCDLEFRNVAVTIGG